MLLFCGGKCKAESTRVYNIMYTSPIYIQIIRVTAHINFEQSFSIVFSLFEVPETDHFVAQQEELNAMRKMLSDDSGCRGVTLHGLSRISKT